MIREQLVVEGPSTGSGRTGLGGARAVRCGGCEGGQGCTAPRPCPGFPFSRERRWAGCGPVGAAGGGGGPFVCPQDRLRQAQGERIWEAPLRRGGGCDGGRGCPAPRPCPGFPFSRERRWAGCGPVGAGGPPSCVLRTGFDRVRANGLGERACGGVLVGLGSGWGVVLGRRHASGFLIALEVEWGAMAVWWVWPSWVVVALEDVSFRGGWLS